MFLLAALLAATADGAALASARAAQHELRQRLGTATGATRGDFAGRIQYVLERYRNNPIVLIDVLDLVCNALKHGLLPVEDWTSLWPKGVLPDGFRLQLGKTFPNPGVYSPLGELLPWFAEQFETRARVLTAEGVKSYTVVTWDPSVRRWVEHPLAPPFLRGTRWSSDLLNARPEGWAIWPYAFFYDDLFSMLDWVRATHPALAGLGIREAFARSKAWHAALPMERTPNGLSRGLIVASWPDGATIERLLTPKNMADEGRAMGHCIASYTGEATSGHRLYFTYRDATGLSHASWEMIPATGKAGMWTTDPFVVQLHGPGNGAIRDPAIQSRLAAWFVGHHVPLGNVAWRLDQVSDLGQIEEPVVLPLSTMPEEARAKKPGVDWAALEAADAATWTEPLQTAAKALFSLNEDVESALWSLEESEELMGLFHIDQSTESSRRRLETAVEQGLGDALEMDLFDANGLREKAASLAKMDRAAPPSLPGWWHGVSTLVGALRAQADHLDLAEALREREWFVDEDPLTFSADAQIERVEWDRSTYSGEATASLERFFDEWRTSPLTSFVWSEHRHADDGRYWVRSEEAVDDRTTAWLSFGSPRGYSDDLSVQAGPTGRPFRGTRFKSPLAALWATGIVVSRAEREAQLAAIREKQGALFAHAPSVSLSSEATLVASPRAAVEAARTAGQVVPYAILRQVGAE